jgi:hypothetical protein
MNTPEDIENLEREELRRISKRMKNNYVVKRSRLGYTVKVRLRTKQEVENLLSYLTKPLLSTYTISFRKELTQCGDSSYLVF